MNFSIIESPIGPLLITGDAEGIRSLSFPKRPGLVRHDRSLHLSSPLFPADSLKDAVHATPPHDAIRDDAAFDEPRRQLDAYFAGTLREFDLALAPRGTGFQLRVWSRLRSIPYGQTASYREIAESIGSPDAVRAVGAANGANPLPLFIPCHRVIATNGSLTGFGGGVDVKRFLLDLEMYSPRAEGRRKQ